MVDGVNFNPFTGKALTAEEIQKLDTNNDGVVSSTELAENLNSISLNETDDEGDVQIEDTTQQTKPETGVTAMSIANKKKEKERRKKNNIVFMTHPLKKVLLVFRVNNHLHRNKTADKTGCVNDHLQQKNHLQKKPRTEPTRPKQLR